MESRQPTVGGFLKFEANREKLGVKLSIQMSLLEKILIKKYFKVLIILSFSRFRATDMVLKQN